jgi:predicted  nucleic acid-binding Zn-ribbon protein
MSSTDGEDAMRNMTDKATYDRLQKDVEAVKNDISALADQISDVIEAFKGDASRQARRTYKQARANVDSLMSDAGKRGSEALDAAQDYAGLAVGLGFLIGVTWRR